MDQFDLLNESVIRIDGDGLICGFNRGSEDLYGRGRQEAVGRHFKECLGEEGGDWLSRVAISDRWHGNVTRRGVSGTLRVSLRWAAQRDDKGVLVGIVETGRQVEELPHPPAATDARPFGEILRSEANYRHLFDVMHVGLLEHDFTQVDVQLARYRAEGVVDLKAHLLADPARTLEILDAMHVTSVNDQALRIFGVDRRDQVGPGLRWLWPEDSYEIVAQAIDGRYRKELMPQTETRVRRRDGSIIDVSLAIWAEPERLPGQPVITAIIDISDRVAAQRRLERLRADFAHASRISTLGEMTASIAHEISQPLSAVISNTVIAERIVEQSGSGHHVKLLSMIQHTTHAAKRAADIVSRIRMAATPMPFEPELLSLDEVVFEAMQFVREELTHSNVTCAHTRATVLPPIAGDRIQLQQVIVNLILNAIQAMSDEVSQPRLITVSTWAQAGRASIRVEDTGRGIPPDRLEQVFESFYTTKAGGMGIGLAVCRSIVEQHGGAIKAYNLSPGSCFEINLPLA